MPKLTTKKLMIYFIYFQVEQGEKRQMNEESEEIDKETYIQASKQTRKALEASEEEMKKQNDNGRSRIALTKKRMSI
jgi:hypothetical protein